ncbi:FAD-dependent thymidylate synthase [Conexibacter sp. JD483]|uniref:FAD-dependent thymidylate synthase n=1 Tax=unclassified Conexibacter TaxID=2627773 RepID=UPI0027292A11|nr:MULTISPECIES: FAD-dependent thymidylate synthase [unclassified Conexibacter]MDO8185689.1 FAD-dependent thymidylate synthase [Conexibacter sp. CPCC 205706]MDO8199066.1 FAD-dependent thymidylate synthase [Conexibacter sp. CPCC 205762]MDR9370515.1 FAD-dependent thymidylate synthase [Conexibacter sp. JD483]
MSPAEVFSDDERTLLARHVTDVDAPVFALVDLPETVKAALFARYSRHPGTLRRLLLDEFAGDLPPAPAGSAHATPSPAAPAPPAGRAAELYERVFVGYGDDSVAQLGGVHVACEWVSNVLTKILQRPRLGAYLEQSTRYIAYDQPLPGAGGGWRYHREAALGPEYERAMDELFATYARLLPAMTAWVAERFPAAAGGSAGRAAHARAVKAKALDLVRGLLPAGSLSHMGLFASGQAVEALILHLLAHPLPEARRCGEQLLRAVRAALPSFVARVERPDRGGVWIDYLRERGAAETRIARQLGLDDASVYAATPEGPSVRLTHVDGDEQRLLTALLFEAAGTSEARVRARVERLTAEQRADAIAELCGPRSNRRHRPGRGFEALRYRFEIVSDYGAFRDLQRHRMLTVQWQTLTPHLGAAVPTEVEAAGRGDDYRRALDVSRTAWQRLVDDGHRAQAPYALCLGHRIRYVLDLNAREAMHVAELRSGREGHPAYRAVAQQLHRLIADVHPAVGAAMRFVDHGEEPRLERIEAEQRRAARE